MSPLVTAENISVSYGGERILDSVSLAVSRGEIVTLIGPNGSGKTTLVRALLGLVALNSGRIVRHTTRIGYVPQSFARDKSLPMTARRFVAGFGEAGAQDALEALARAGVEETAERQLASLSGGEMARVGLARALLRQPEILFLDEPLSGVDLAGEAALYELIAEVRNETGAAIFLVSHDLHVVMATADRVICLNHHICCEGDAKSVVKDPGFVAMFGPGLAAQLAVYTHHHDHAHAPSGAVLDPADAHHGHKHG
jgi:zinc transport system ATP-binding protein